MSVRHLTESYFGQCVRNFWVRLSGSLVEASSEIII